MENEVIKSSIFIFALIGLPCCILYHLCELEIKDLLINFKRRKEYKIIKMYIKEESKKLFKQLKLPELPIGFITDYNNCSFTIHKDNKLSLLFGLKCLYDLKINGVLDSIVPKDTHFNRIYYTLCHEIAHYLQCYKHKSWFNKYSLQYGQMKKFVLSDRGYANIKLEKNANKIAKILLKRYKGGKL